MHKIKEVNIRVLVIVIIMLLSINLFGAAKYQTHKVRKGDTLYGLSKKYGVTVDNLLKLNRLKTDKLSLGQQLIIKPEQPKPKPAKPEKQPVTPVVAKPVANPTMPDSRPQDNSVITAPAAKPKQDAQITLPTQPQATETPQTIPANLSEDYYHTVLPKENLYRIALNANITLPELLKYNLYPDANVVIKPGMKLIVKDWTGQPQSSNPATEMSITAPPEPSNIPETVAEGDSVFIEKIYVVQRKDTLFKIAKENNMTVEQLKTLNKLTDNSIKTGQRLYIIAPKGGVEEEPTVVPVVITEEELKAKAKIRSDLIMPVESKVISEYGIRNGRPHKGIDLGAPTGTPVFSVLDGTIVYSGHQGNYGNVVVVEHPDFIMTVYGHNEKNLVSVGDVVKQGQMIATTGSTGNATAPHVHFEYRIKGKAINPRKVLPFGQ